MSKVEEPVFCMAKSLQALFNEETSSDITLDVNGHIFYGHSAILVPLCGYLEPFLQFPRSKSKRSDKAGKRTIKISLPSLQIPEYWTGRELYASRFWFERFLRILYGLIDLDCEDPEEIFIMIQIADYLVCDEMLQQCDDALATMTFTKDNVLDVALFFQKFHLPKTFESAKWVITNNWYNLRLDPKLYAIERKHFQRMMKLPCNNRCGQFFTLYRYVTGQDSNESIEPGPGIKDPEMRAMFQDVVNECSPEWDRGALYKVVNAFKSNQTALLLNGAQEDQLFLFRTFSNCYHRLYGPSGH